MEDKIYKITLSDETVLDNLRLNGNNFISSSEINESVFDGNCSIVTINDGEKDEVHMNMELVQITKVNDKYWLSCGRFQKQSWPLLKCSQISNMLP